MRLSCAGDLSGEETEGPSFSNDKESGAGLWGAEVQARSPGGLERDQGG